MVRQDAAGLILLIASRQELALRLGEHLARQGYAVNYAADGASGVRLAHAGSYDVIVLDRMLTDTDGIEACRRLRQQAGRATPLLMLTARDDVDDRVAGLDAGADDCLVLPFELRELDARLRALIRRDRRRATSQVYTVGDLVLDTGTMQLTRRGQRLALPPTSLRILAILMRESPRLVARRDLEREVWGNRLPDSDTLRSHVYNLRKVIDKPFDHSLLHTIHASGYRLADLGSDAARTTPTQVRLHQVWGGKR